MEVHLTTGDIIHVFFLEGGGGIFIKVKELLIILLA